MKSTTFPHQLGGWGGGGQLFPTSADRATLRLSSPLRLPAETSAYLSDLIKNILLISPVLASRNVLRGIFARVQGYRPRVSLATLQTEHSKAVDAIAATASVNTAPSSLTRRSTRLLFADLLLFSSFYLFIFRTSEPTMK